jgi:nitrite reductase/ring-hydroxylating ferredoxin subunit
MIDGVPILLASADERWYAIEDRCSHAGCAFSADGELDGTTLICDCHGSEFDIRTGEPLVMPANQPIRSYAVRETDGRLEVEL